MSLVSTSGKLPKKWLASQGMAAPSCQVLPNEFGFNFRQVAQKVAGKPRHGSAISQLVSQSLEQTPRAVI
jgi:hypothetical protein